MRTHQAYQAFKLWYHDESPFSAEPTDAELHEFAAALTAPTVTAALAKIGATEGDRSLSSAEQDRQNRAKMRRIRQRFEIRLS